MKIPFTNREIKLIRNPNAPAPSKINEDSVNKLYESLSRYLGKGLFVWNKSDFKAIIEEGYLFNPDVYSIINKIIQTASTVSFELYEVKNDKMLSKYRSAVKNFHMDDALMYRTKALEPVEEHDILKLLDNPNPNTTNTVFTQSFLGYYCLLGNSYLYKIVVAGSKDNMPGELQVLPAYMVKIIFGSPAQPIKGYSIDDWNNTKYNFLPEEIYHFKTFNPDYSTNQFMYGAMPSANPSMTKSNKSYTAAVSLITNLGAMGILSSGNDMTIAPEGAKAIRDKYMAEYGGEKNRGKIMIVGQKMEYINMAQSITDLNLIQGQEQDFLTLCRVYNIDSRIMGYVKGSTFSNMAEAKKDFMQNRILPLKYMEAEAYNKFLIPSYEARDKKKYHLDICTDDIPEMQTDLDKLSTRIQNEIKKGLLSPAEGAKLLGYPELTDELAKGLWVGTDMIPISKAAQAQQPKPVPGTPAAIPPVE